MKVKATQRGFWPNGRERNPGDEFDYDGPTKKKIVDKRDHNGNPISHKTVDYFPSWMEEVSGPKPDPDDEAKKAGE